MAVKVRERKKGSGEWWIFIDYQGKRKAKKAGRNKRLAEQLAKKIEAKLLLGDFSIDQDQEEKPKFEDYAATWLAVTVPATCKPSTAEDYQGIMDNHVLPHFGRMPIENINRMMVKKFLMGKIKDGLSQSTVAHMKSCLSGVFSIAVDDEVLSGNPSHGLGKIFRARNLNEDVNPLTQLELVDLMEAFQEHMPEHYPMALTLARTGMRLGEVLALKWEDVDFDERSIKVRRTYARGKIGPPKNGKSRTVDMSRQLTKVLQNHRLQQKHHALKFGWRSVPKWVFVNSVGKPLDINHWRRRVFYRVLKEAGIKKMRVHDLRHTYASLLIQGGESLAYVRDQMGHHSIKVTVDIYGHLTPGGNKAAVDRLDDVIQDATIRNLSATKEKGVNQIHG
jgi:integrase